MAGKRQYTDDQLDVLKAVLTENPGFTIQEVAKELARPERWGLEVKTTILSSLLRSNDRVMTLFGSDTIQVFRENLKKARDVHRGYAPEPEPLKLDRGFSSFARSLQISK